MFTKKEFNILVLLYSANIDGNVDDDELTAILDNTDRDTFRNVKKIFRKMSDIEVLESITKYKKQYLATPDDKKQLLSDIHKIFFADDHLSAMEKRLKHVIEALID